MIKVAIYEDNVGLREVLVEIIKSTSDFELSGEFGNCLDIIKNTRVYNPDVILMDIDMPGKSGIEGVSEVKKEFPNVEVIMNTVFDDDNRIFEAIQAGATGYMLKKNSLTNLIQSIREVKEGGAPMSPSIARKVLAFNGNFNQQKSSSSTKKFDLSERESEVLQYMAKGLSYKMVANELNLSVDTIRSHVKKIYEKLHVHSITEAIHKVYIDQ